MSQPNRAAKPSSQAPQGRPKNPKTNFARRITPESVEHIAAALRPGSLVVDGAMNGEVVRGDAEQVLAPTLSPGDVRPPATLIRTAPAAPPPSAGATRSGLQPIHDLVGPEPLEPNQRLVEYGQIGRICAVIVG